MENIVPPLKLIWFVRKSVEKGRSVKVGINEYIDAGSDCWHDEVSKWLVLVQQGISTHKMIHSQRTILRKQLLMTLERGLKGESIHKNLISLEDEIHDQIDVQAQELMSRLPYLMLIPIALFFFPSCLIMMLGPFILQLTSSF